MFLSSFYIFSGIIKKSTQEQTILRYINENFPNAIYEMERVDNSDSLEVKILLGKYLSPDSIRSIVKEIQKEGVGKFKLDFLQDTESRKAIEQLRSTEANYLQVIETSQDQQQEKDKID